MGFGAEVMIAIRRSLLAWLLFVRFHVLFASCAVCGAMSS